VTIEQRIKKIEDAIKHQIKDCFGIVIYRKGETTEEAEARTEKETGKKRCENIIFLPNTPNI